LNKYIGTVEIKILDKTYTLRPSFDAIVEFEDQAGMALLEAHNRLVQGKAGFKIIAAIIWAGVKGHALFENDPKQEVSFRVIGEEIRQHGFTKVIPEVVKFMTYAIVSFEDIEKIEGEETPSK